MADGATLVGFPGRQGFKRLNTTIRDEVRCLMTGLQKDEEANHAMQAIASFEDLKVAPRDNRSMFFSSYP